MLYTGGEVREGDQRRCSVHHHQWGQDVVHREVSWDCEQPEDRNQRPVQREVSSSRNEATTPTEWRRDWVRVRNLRPEFSRAPQSRPEL